MKNNNTKSWVENEHIIRQGIEDFYFRACIALTRMSSVTFWFGNENAPTLF